MKSDSEIDCRKILCVKQRENPGYRHFLLKNIVFQ